MTDFSDLKPEARAELEEFATHLGQHYDTPRDDCRFCALRLARKPETRCSSAQPMGDSLYRCIHSWGDGHTEHHYNFYRKLAPEERKRYGTDTEEADDDRS